MDTFKGIINLLNQIEAKEILVSEAFEKATIEMNEFRSLNDELKKTIKNIDKREAVRQNGVYDVDSYRKYLKPSLSFKPLKMVLDYLQRKDELFDGLNTYQLGIMLKRCGFKPSTRDQKRGYYVSYKEL
jgi:hypothetical protein